MKFFKLLIRTILELFSQTSKSIIDNKNINRSQNEKYIHFESLDKNNIPNDFI